jgi:hypothetical protein
MRVLAILLACLPVTTAYAGLKQGRIVSVLTASSIPDKVFIKVEGNYSASQPEPSCGTGASQWDFALDLTTAHGKTIYALVLAAQAAQTTVTAGGLGTCTLRAGYEDLDYIHTDN